MHWTPSMAREKSSPGPNWAMQMTYTGASHRMVRAAISSQDQLPQQIRITDLLAHAERNLSLPQGLRIYGLTWTPGRESVPCICEPSR
jgi:hypothetical protein